MHETEPTPAGTARAPTFSPETVDTFSVGFGKPVWQPTALRRQPSAAVSRRELGYPAC